jgi:DNA-binding PadR family transcriptional regulator
VLGFLSILGEATPYDLKRMVSISVGYFWSFPHSQLYAEPDRLAAAGYVVVRQEPGGRRRKLYKLTEAGEKALARWRTELPSEEVYEIRDVATLKLFFGANPVDLARAEVGILGDELRKLEAIRQEAAAPDPPGPRLALEYGIHMLRASLSFWADIAAERER